MSTISATVPAVKPTRKPRRKPTRSIGLRLKPFGLERGVVEINVGKDKSEYLLAEQAADYGRGFELEKIGGLEVYHVNVEGDKKTCDCKGQERWGHCKHADGLAALIAAGRL